MGEMEASVHTLDTLKPPPLLFCEAISILWTLGMGPVLNVFFLEGQGSHSGLESCSSSEDHLQGEAIHVPATQLL